MDKLHRYYMSAERLAALGSYAQLVCGGSLSCDNMHYHRAYESRALLIPCGIYLLPGRWMLYNEPEIYYYHRTQEEACREALC